MSEYEDTEDSARTDYLKAKRKYSEALRVGTEHQRLNPSMIRGEGKKPWKPVEDATIAGASSRAFLTAFGNGGSETRSERPQVNQSNLKADILKAVIASGRSPEESAKLMEQLSPYLLAVDDPAAALLVSRIGNGGEKLGFKEILEIIQLTKSMQSPPSVSDPASMANAITNAIRTGAELSSKNGSSDAGTIQSLYQQMTQQQQQSFDRHLELLRERYTDQPSFDEQLAHVMDLQKRLGGLGKESETIQAKRLDLEHQRWAKSQEIDLEKRKASGQAEMIKQITGSLGKVLEAPLVREAGRGLGQALGKASPKAGAFVNAVTGAPQAAARAELNSPPTETPWGLVCHKCKQQTIFTQLDLARIEESGGRWACPSCSEVYELKRPGGENSGP